jgi:hypothetical protein
MNLAEFVEETLSEILTGIRTAQQKDGGGAVGTLGINWSLGHSNPSLLLPGYIDDVFTGVEFDVSVLAETSGGGKTELKVWSVGSLEGGGKRSNQETSRVRFAVQVRVPAGDQAQRPPGF